ncbi:zinc finger A20 and AN1 domain-containing stress-associated protein 7-like [Spinacia oleracea]|uniref:Zinc finger A20 and AN1 domain-containing stress-associated protein 7-like n=1 Tax=Spinacia oleracea TaxID=3562 RepID=A0ABM3QIX6_SPIOL|nr:zinc finger A20 and AN1 domain-containing stress-associated protein 7-like [Spinacia oleracea]
MENNNNNNNNNKNTIDNVQHQASNSTTKNGCGFFGKPTATEELFARAIETKLVKQYDGLVSPFWEAIFRENNARKKHVRVISKVNIDHETTKNRCDSCKKRIKLIGFKCKCDGIYCGSHRYPEVHSCKFDHKEVGRHRLSKTLYASACKAAKINYM